MGYEMFRSLSQLTRIKNKKQKTIFTEGFLNPGINFLLLQNIFRRPSM